MNSEEIRAVIEQVIASKIVLTYWQFALFIFLSAVAAYFGAYLKQKGMNLATKEDVAQLTAKVAEINTDYAKRLEEYRYEIKVREQAAKVAEYMVVACQLQESSPPADYERANRLAWELAMWLPPEIYRCMAESLANPTEVNNPLVVVVAVRKLLLGDNAGDLRVDNLLHHAPGIGRQKLASPDIQA